MSLSTPLDAVCQRSVNPEALRDCIVDVLNDVIQDVERFAVQAVARRMPPDRGDPLRAEVMQYVREEHAHSRAHRALQLRGDVVVGAAHFPVLERILGRLPRSRLGLPVAAAGEILFCHLGRAVLSPVWLRGLPAEVQEVYRHHAVEEIEHAHVVPNLMLRHGVSRPMRALGWVFVFLMTVMLAGPVWRRWRQVRPVDGELLRQAVDVLVGKYALISVLTAACVDYGRRCVLSDRPLDAEVWCEVGR